MCSTCSTVCSPGAWGLAGSLLFDQHQSSQDRVPITGHATVSVGFVAATTGEVLAGSRTIDTRL